MYIAAIIPSVNKYVCSAECMTFYYPCQGLKCVHITFSTPPGYSVHTACCVQDGFDFTLDSPLNKFPFPSGWTETTFEQLHLLRRHTCVCKCIHKLCAQRNQKLQCHIRLGCHELNNKRFIHLELTQHIILSFQLYIYWEFRQNGIVLQWSIIWHECQEVIVMTPIIKVKDLRILLIPIQQ